MKKLPVLCPQAYEGYDMKVTPCNRCPQWAGTRCTVQTGCEHLPLEPADKVPTCPIQERCQHQIQSAPLPCPVRARGMVCESALRWAGDPNPEGHPLSFHASTVASLEEWNAYMLTQKVK